MKVFSITLILISSIIASSCHNNEHEKEETTFSVTKPWRQEVTVERNYVAQIKASQHIELRAFEKGYLQEIYVDEGQMIKKGEKMFQIMPLLMQAKFQKAKAKLELVEIEYKNTKSLADKKVVSANELALAKAKLSKAQADLDLAQTHLNLTTITAPFDGLMDKFQVRLGSLIEEGELLTTLSDITKLWVYFNVSEVDYLNYMKQKKEASQTPVSLQLANGDMYQHQGMIDTIEADFDNETGNVAFRATFPNPDALLRHGETGTVILKESLGNALIIPQKSTFEILDKRYVYVVDQSGEVKTREIKVDNEIPHFFIIQSGVSEQDQILLEGLGKVSQGKKIKTKYIEQVEVLKNLELAAN